MQEHSTCSLFAQHSGAIYSEAAAGKFRTETCQGCARRTELLVSDRAWETPPPAREVTAVPMPGPDQLSLAQLQQFKSKVDVETYKEYYCYYY